LITTIFLIAGSVTASMISLRYGTRDVRHLPGSAELSGDKYLSRSAQALTVNCLGGRSEAAAARCADSPAFVLSIISMPSV
jgi:hypothetical protein